MTDSPRSSNDQCVVQCSWIDACTGRRCVLHQGHAATGVQGGHDVYGLDTSDLTPEQEIDRLVAARTGPGRPMVQRPNEAPYLECAGCHVWCPGEPPPGKWTEENGRHYCYECSIKLGKRPNEVTPTSPSLEKEATLECGHCGGVAITSPNGWFWDGAGGRCLECGHPGHVSCDGEEPPYWHVHEGALDFCAAHDCDECNERRRDLIVEPARRTQDTQYSEGDWIDLRCRCCKSHPLMRGWKFCPDCGNGIRAELRENAKPYTTPRSDNPQRDAKMPVLVDIVVARRFVREINSYETPEAAAKALAAEFAEVRRIALSYAPRVDYPTVTELLDVLRRIAKYSTDPIVAADAATAVRQVESRSDSVTTPEKKP